MAIRNYFKTGNRIVVNFGFDTEDQYDIPDAYPRVLDNGSLLICNGSDLDVVAAYPDGRWYNVIPEWTGSSTDPE